MNDLHEVKKISVRSSGNDEKWLETHIIDNPSCLGLGELEVVANQRDAGGGILDILMRDADGATMYEVEVQLGATDPSHIIRTIEYWSNEKRKWPNRQHYAVLVAEDITRRFYDVMQELGHAIPFIAIQVSLLEIQGNRALQFQTLLDTYQEPDDDTGADIVDRKYWQGKQNKKHILEPVDTMLEIFKKQEPALQINYTRSYCAIQMIGRNLLWVRPRARGNMQISFRTNGDTGLAVDELLIDAELLDYQETKKGRKFITNVSWIEENGEKLERLFEQILKFHE